MNAVSGIRRIDTVMVAFYSLQLRGSLQHMSICGTRAHLHTVTESPLGATGVVHYLQYHVNVDKNVQSIGLSQP